MTLSLEYIDTPHTEQRAVRRARQLKINKIEHVCTVYHKMDQSLSRAAEYLQSETEQTERRRTKKQTTRAQRQTKDVQLTQQTQDTKTKPKVNTAHSTPTVDPVTGLTWQEKRAARQLRRQQQQQQLTYAWADKMEILLEAHVPERLILPLLRKYEGDVDAILAYHVAYHQQRVQQKQRASQQRVKKSYADTTLVRSCAAEENMLLAIDPTLSGHLRDVVLV